MKGIILCSLFLFVVICCSNGAPVETQPYTKKSARAVGASASKRLNIAPYYNNSSVSTKSYIDTHPHPKKRRHYHKRHHKLHRRRHRHKLVYPLKDRLQYFGGGSSELMPSAKPRHEDFEMTNGEVFEHGGVPDLRRDAVPPIEGERALSIQNDTTAKYSTQSDISSTSDEKDLLPDNNTNIESTHMARDELEGSAVSLNKSTEDSTSLNLYKDVGNKLLTNHLKFLLHNTSNLCNSTCESYNNKPKTDIVSNETYSSSSANDTKSPSITQIYNTNEKTNISVSNDAVNASTQKNDNVSLSNLHSLIKDLVSLDESIFLVEHALNMNDENKSKYSSDTQVNNGAPLLVNNVSKNTGNTTDVKRNSSSSVGKSSAVGKSVTKVNNGPLGKAHDNIEELILRCLGFDSGNKSSHLSNMSSSLHNITGNESNTSSILHTSSGDIVLSCSDFDTSNIRQPKQNVTDSLARAFAKNNTKNVQSSSSKHIDVSQNHSLYQKRNQTKQLHNATNSKNHTVKHEQNVSTAQKNNKTLNKYSSRRPKPKNKSSAHNQMRITPTSHLFVDKNTTSGNKTHKKNKNRTHTLHDQKEERSRGNIYDNSTIILFNGTDPNLRQLVNDVIDVGNSNTYYYSYAPNQKKVRVYNNTNGTASEIQLRGGDLLQSRKHTSLKYQNTGNNRKKIQKLGSSQLVDVANQLEEIARQVYPTDMYHISTSLSDQNASLRNPRYQNKFKNAVANSVPVTNHGYNTNKNDKVGDFINLANHFTHVYGYNAGVDNKLGNTVPNNGGLNIVPQEGIDNKISIVPGNKHLHNKIDGNAYNNNDLRNKNVAISFKNKELGNKTATNMQNKDIHNKNLVILISNKDIHDKDKVNHRISSNDLRFKNVGTISNNKNLGKVIVVDHKDHATSGIRYTNVHNKGVGILLKSNKDVGHAYNEDEGVVLNNKDLHDSNTAILLKQGDLKEKTAPLVYYKDVPHQNVGVLNTNYKDLDYKDQAIALNNEELNNGGLSVVTGNKDLGDRNLAAALTHKYLENKAASPMQYKDVHYKDVAVGLKSNKYLGTKDGSVVIYSKELDNSDESVVPDNNYFGNRSVHIVHNHNDLEDKATPEMHYKDMHNSNVDTVPENIKALGNKEQTIVFKNEELNNGGLSVVTGIKDLKDRNLGVVLKHKYLQNKAASPLHDKDIHYKDLGIRLKGNNYFGTKDGSVVLYSKELDNNDDSDVLDTYHGNRSTHIVLNHDDLEDKAASAVHYKDMQNNDVDIVPENNKALENKDEDTAINSKEIGNIYPGFGPMNKDLDDRNAAVVVNQDLQDNAYSALHYKDYKDLHNKNVAIALVNTQMDNKHEPIIGNNKELDSSDERTASKVEDLDNVYAPIEPTTDLANETENAVLYKCCVLGQENVRITPSSKDVEDKHASYKDAYDKNVGIVHSKEDLGNNSASAMLSDKELDGRGTDGGSNSNIFGYNKLYQNKDLEAENAAIMFSNEELQNKAAPTIRYRDVYNKSLGIVVRDKDLVNNSAAIMFNDNDINNGAEGVISNNKKLGEKNAAIVLKGKDIDDINTGTILKSMDLEDKFAQTVHYTNVYNKNIGIVPNNKELGNNSAAIVLAGKELDNRDISDVSNIKNLGNEGTAFVLKGKDLEEKASPIIHYKDLNNVKIGMAPNDKDLGNNIAAMMLNNKDLDNRTEGNKELDSKIADVVSNGEKLGSKLVPVVHLNVLNSKAFDNNTEAENILYPKGSDTRAVDVGSNCKDLNNKNSACLVVHFNDLNINTKAFDNKTEAENMLHPKGSDTRSADVNSNCKDSNNKNAACLVSIDDLQNKQPSIEQYKDLSKGYIDILRKDLDSKNAVLIPYTNESHNNVGYSSTESDNKIASPLLGNAGVEDNGTHFKYNMNIGNKNEDINNRYVENIVPVTHAETIDVARAPPILGNKGIPDTDLPILPYNGLSDKTAASIRHNSNNENAVEPILSNDLNIDNKGNRSIDMAISNKDVGNTLKPFSHNSKDIGNIYNEDTDIESINKGLDETNAAIAHGKDLDNTHATTVVNNKILENTFVPNLNNNNKDLGNNNEALVPYKDSVNKAMPVMRHNEDIGNKNGVTTSERGSENTEVLAQNITYLDNNLSIASNTNGLENSTSIILPDSNSLGSKNVAIENKDKNSINLYTYNLDKNKDDSNKIIALVSNKDLGNISPVIFGHNKNVDDPKGGTTVSKGLENRFTTILHDNKDAGSNDKVTTTNKGLDEKVAPVFGNNNDLNNKNSVSPNNKEAVQNNHNLGKINIATVSKDKGLGYYAAATLQNKADLYNNNVAVVVEKYLENDAPTHNDRVFDNKNTPAAFNSKVLQNDQLDITRGNNNEALASKVIMTDNRAVDNKDGDGILNNGYLYNQTASTLFNNKDDANLKDKFVILNKVIGMDPAAILVNGKYLQFLSNSSSSDHTFDVSQKNMNNVYYPVQGLVSHAFPIKQQNEHPVINNKATEVAHNLTDENDVIDNSIALKKTITLNSSNIANQFLIDLTKAANAAPKSDFNSDNNTGVVQVDDGVNAAEGMTFPEEDGGDDDDDRNDTFTFNDVGDVNPHIYLKHTPSDNTGNNLTLVIFHNDDESSKSNSSERRPLNKGNKGTSKVSEGYLHNNLGTTRQNNKHNESVINNDNDNSHNVITTEPHNFPNVKLHDTNDEDNNFYLLRYSLGNSRRNHNNKSSPNLHNINDGKSILNNLSSTMNNRVSNETNVRNDHGNLIFQDYLMKPNGHMMAIGNIAVMPKRHSSTDHTNPSYNTVMSLVHSPGYGTHTGVKHDYVMSLASHGFQANSTDWD